MTTRTPTTVEQDFHRRMHAAGIYGLWELASQMTKHPEPQAVPHMWRAKLLDAMVSEAAEVVPVGEERRALQLFNPGLDGRWATTNTMIAAVQILLPGETARAHRHTPTAIRFIMEGDGAYTAVDGERVYMAPGDLVLTPSWAWHDHGNETDHRVVWMDGLDVPLVQAVNSWEQTWAALQALADGAGDRHDGIALEYTHPHTGRALLPTMACWIQMLRPGERLAAHRHTGSAVYYVVRGAGESIIDGCRYSWSPGDVITLPSWALHEHANPGREPAVLFSIQDRPVLESLGLYREEALADGGGHQTVTGTFGG
jgi:gentisate 1,2-dioxygenase